jgi:hypothetical protein
MAQQGQGGQPQGGQQVAQPTIQELIDTANIHIGEIANAFGIDGANLTNVLDRNQNINLELGKINAVIEDFDIQLNNLIDQLSNSKSEEEFQQLEQQIRDFLTRFNELIPTLNVNRLDANTSQEQLTNATQIITNIKNKAYAYIRKGQNFPANANPQFIAANNLIKGIYTREGNTQTFINNTNTRITFTLDQGRFIPTNINLNGSGDIQVQPNGLNFTATINGNQYFLIAYAFQNIPALAGGSKRKRRRTRKNKRKSKAKKQKGGFGYNKIPYSKKKSSKRKTSTRTSSNTNTTSTSSRK